MAMEKSTYSKSRSESESSSSSSLDQDYSCKDGLPQSASCWTRQHLETLGIVYSETPITAAELLSVIKNRAPNYKDHMDRIPDIGLKLMELTNQVVNFSFDFVNEGPFSQGDLIVFDRKVDKMFEDFQSQIVNFKSTNHDILLDPFNDRVYQKWLSNAIEFLSYLRIFAERNARLQTREGSFQELLHHFTKICLLNPENGVSLVSRLQIQGREVSGIPDVRFPAYIKQGIIGEKTVMVTTVDRSHLHKVDINSFSMDNLPDSVLGQLGIQLLLEYKRSVFEPAVCGLLCMGTKLVFTVLELGPKKFARLYTGNILEEEEKSTILYSKAYDYMDCDERREILEMCFWLGHVQHDAYRSLYPYP